MSFMISAEALYQQLDARDLRIVDASWYLPAQGRNAKAEYAAGHLPGAVFFDQDAIVTPDTGLPHTIPTPEIFAQAVGKMGIAQDDDIVVYDGPGLFSAPRVWWLFRVFGASRVRILAGGLDGWAVKGLPLTTQSVDSTACHFESSFNAKALTYFNDMLNYVQHGERQIADARPLGRFTADVAEPRAGMRSGHMPGARSLFFGDLIRDGDLLPEAELRDVIARSAIDLDKPIVTSCGSGVTAAVLSLALETLGHKDHTLYDGSWSEWGGRDDTPIDTGPADRAAS